MLRKLTCVLTALTFLFIITQCSKNPVSGIVDDKVDDPSSEILQLESEIDLEHESALMDTTDENLERRFRIAIHKLNRLLRKAHKFVMLSDNDEAKELLGEAYQARENAIESAENGQYDEAFDYIKESVYMAIEAVKLVKDEVIEKLKEIEKRLIDRMAQLKDLLEEVKTQLEAQENPIANRVFIRALHHFREAGDALREHKLRHAGFHIRESFKLAHLALRILQNNSDD